MEEVSVIVVAHNSGRVIGDCLDTLQGCAEVIVVDNASTDGTVAEVRKRLWVKLIATSENLGFAGGVNRGARAAKSPCLLVLNPDVALTSKLEPMVAACREHGIAAGCLTDEDGAPQIGFAIRRLPTPWMLSFECLGINALWKSNPINRSYRCLDQDLAKPAFVEQPAGAFLMIRSDVFRGLGGFDETFWPVWFEDVDFCRRAKDAGYRIAHIPAVRAAHIGGHSVKNISPIYQRLYWYGSLLKYAGKHYRPIAFRAVCFAVIIGSLVRSVTGIGTRRSERLFEVYGRVIRLAASAMLTGHVVCPETAGFLNRARSCSAGGR